jgi:phospholipase D1/2
VRLLRGEDHQGGDEEVRFLPFLNRLCEKNPDLHIYILAWNFSLIYALEREWWQEYIFNWTTHERLQFRFDDCHPFGASHHQKFVVVDGNLAFVGGGDICASRWDERDHRAVHPERYDNEAKPYGPYHEIQSYHVGAVAQRLAELFALRWQQSGGGPLELTPSLPKSDVPIEPTITIAATHVALSRTQPPMLTPPQRAVQEIYQLYRDAITAAERLIYLENQYFSSEAIYTTLVERMRSRRRSRLQIVVILPKRPEAFLEEVAMGFAQAKMLRSLVEIAHETGHAFGVYYPTTTNENGREVPTYIHAKLLLVDDRFLTIGSANTTNRSLGLDTELNVSWEAFSPQQQTLIQSIRHTRMNLLAEHCGVTIHTDGYALARVEGLVEYLNQLTDGGHCRLRHHPMDTSFDERVWLQALKPENLVIDPARPLFVRVIDKPSSSQFSWSGHSLANASNGVAEPSQQQSESQPASAPPATFLTPQRLEFFLKELANLYTANASQLQLPGHLQWSLVLAATLFAMLLWWWLLRTV